MRAITAVILTAVISTALTHALIPNQATAQDATVRATSFILETPTGEVAGWWTTDETGTPSIVLVAEPNTPNARGSSLSANLLSFIDRDGNAAFYRAGKKRNAITLLKPSGRARYRK